MNAIGQRERVDRTGSAFGDSNAPHASVPSNPIDWSYDILGQVAKADYSDNALNQSYTYDQIGNQVSKTQTTASAQYTSNALNQFTSKTTSGSTENYLYDADGNLLSDGTVTYTWDGEQCEPSSILDRSAATCPQGQNAKDECFDQNRLLSSTENGETTNYQYDYLSRRITKETNGITTEYVYDGWNPISEKTPTLTKYYTWGMDLSGSLQGAGGVGGLLSVTEISSDPNATQESVSNNATHESVLKYYPTYDGNGNVSEYIDVTSTTVAHYQYDAFGNEIDSKTTGANDFAHRFSTKALDAETGFYYYGYRYYDPVDGKWPSRDPIGEEGGDNLYGFVNNDSTNLIDILGWTANQCPCEGAKTCSSKRIDYKLGKKSLGSESLIKIFVEGSIRGKAETCAYDNGSEEIVLTTTAAGSIKGKGKPHPLVVLQAEGTVKGNFKATWCNAEFQGGSGSLSAEFWAGGGLDTGVAQLVGEAGGSWSWDVSVSDAGPVSVTGQSVYLNGRIRLIIGRGRWSHTI